MKMFQIPASDCGHFVAGVVDGNTIDEMKADGAPEHAVVIWYKDKETMIAAMQAASAAHWPAAQ